MTFRQVAILLSFLVATPSLADTNSTFTLPSGVGITIIESAFQRAGFDTEGCAEVSSSCRINGHIPYGVDSGLPKTYVKSITVSFQGASYAVDASNMFNAWGKRPLEYPGVVRYFGGKCFDKTNCQLRGLFSDAAGSFVAEWVIEDGFSTRTVLTSSTDVVSLFIKNIDPPEFN